MVAHCVRFWPGYDILLAAARDGRWGALRSATFTRIGGCAFWSPWFMSEEKSGGAVLDLMVHDFDLCRILGGMPARVEATGSVDGLGPGTGVNYVDVIIRPSAADAPALSVRGGWMPSEGFPFAMRYLAQFQEATLRFDSDADHPLTLYPRTGDPEPVELASGDGYEAEVRYFLSVLGKRPDRCPPEESRDAVAIALAAKESVLSGKAVDI
jgi:predicted dehydrogenase